MTTKDQREQEKIKRAELARQVIENPVYQAALQALRVEVYKKLSTTSPTDAGQLQELALYLQSVDKLEKVLESYYSRGKIILDKRANLAKSTEAS